MSKKNFFSIAILCLVFMAAVNSVFADEPDNGVYESYTNVAILQQALNSELQTIKKQLMELNQRRAVFESGRKDWLKELENYRNQYSAAKNLLALKHTRVEELEQSIKTDEFVLTGISKYLKDFTQEKNSLVESLHNWDSQLNIYLAQIENNKGQEKVENILKQIVKVIQDKKEVSGQLLLQYDKLIQEFNDQKQLMLTLTSQLNAQLNDRVKQNLITRTSLPFSGFSFLKTGNEIQKLIKESTAIFRREFWKNEIEKVNLIGGFFLISFGFFILAVLIVSKKIFQFCRQLECRQSVSWLQTTPVLIQRTIPLIGVLGLIKIYTLLEPAFSTLIVVVIAQKLIMLVFLSVSVVSFIDNITEIKENPENLFVLKYILSLVYGTCAYAVVYFIFKQTLGLQSIIMSIFRLGLGFALLAWTVLFWRLFKAKVKKKDSKPLQFISSAQTLLIFINYMVVLIGLFAEMTGYSSFSMYWYYSWAKTIVSFVFGVVFYQIISDFNKNHLVTEKQEAQFDEQRPPFGWFMIQLGWIGWFVFLVLAVVLSWGDPETVLGGISETIHYSFYVGTIKLNLIGMIYAFLVLFLTHVTARFSKYLLSEKVLFQGNIEKGLQESIISITGYVIWVLGIILALGVIGVSTTSLAVVFGALSIGIGFGLQTIFNNFVSGIILLFERPIQVGDAVEVNGIWGEVKKINIRATIVQTYDNASLIIPNSEFISNQVTNWSFKDPRIRRKLNIGVAYGSDIELVRSTLLEIAGKTAHVLKYPSSDILFLDHADSALIFTLRYWTTIDFIYKSETDLRFEIDRLFRERKIEIAFPQRDIDIRSIVKDASINVSS